MKWKIKMTPQAKRDLKKWRGNPLKRKVDELLRLVENDPLGHPPDYEWLGGDLRGHLSRRINLQHRMVYQLREEQHTVVILRLWSHYGD